MPDDNSELVPPLPIPNRTVKRLSADDSAATSVKVGHRQANIFESPRLVSSGGFFFWCYAFLNEGSAGFIILSRAEAGSDSNNLRIKIKLSQGWFSKKLLSKPRPVTRTDRK